MKWTQEERLSQASRFLTRLFGTSWGAAWLPILTFDDVVRKKEPPSAVFWCQSAEDAARVALRESESAEVYLGCCLRAPRIPKELEGRPHKYGEASDTVACPGVWLDIDMASPFRSKGVRYPESEEACVELLDAAGLLPSAVVRSGYGLQPWWLFDGPQDTSDPISHKRMEQLSEGWLRKAQEVWKAAGYQLDGKFSLATILRVPGTWNRKNMAEPRRVELESMPGARYTLEELEEACGRHLQSIFENWTRTAGVEVGSFTIRAAAEPPAGRFAALLENVPAFRNSWRKQRSDLGDQSLSGYGMSLATFAADAGWSDQEITDLLVAHARLYGKGPQGPSYYRHTIGKARQSARGRREKREAKEDEREARKAETRAAIADGNGKSLDALRGRLGLAVNGVVQRGKSPAHYYLCIDTLEPVSLGTATNIMSQSHFRSAIYEATGCVVHHFEGPDWDDILKLFSAVKRIEELSEGDRAQETRDWIAQHVEDAVNGRGLPDRASEERDRMEVFHHAVRAKAPFRDSRNGCIYVNTSGLVNWLRIGDGILISNNDARIRLSELGFSSVVVEVQRIIGHFRRSYWNCGNGWLEEQTQ